MATVIQFEQQGPPEVLTPVDQAFPEPGPGEILLQQTAVGVNYLDVYFRNGHFPVNEFPHVTGFEGAGVVVDKGEGVTDFTVGQRVAYQLAGGAYAEYRKVPVSRCVALPDGISDETAAAVMLKGTTAEYLAERIKPLGLGNTALVHAASGGVGSILTQWLAANAVSVIATVGTDQKAALARANGAAETVNYREQDFVESVNDATDGKGVDVIFDGVGKATFHKNFDCLAKMGMNVLFGWASGRVGEVDVDKLNGNSHQVANPSLGHYTGTSEQLRKSANRLFQMLESAKIKAPPVTNFSLDDAALAHERLEARATMGALVLTP